LHSSLYFSLCKTRKRFDKRMTTKKQFSF
jgi:hypothetical protein